MRTLQGLLLACTICWVFGCNLINPAEGIPSYVAIDDISISTDTQEGSASSKITELWVFDGGTMLGAYDLPAYVPVLAEGERDFSIRAGIKNNGIANTRIMYPFFNPFDATLDLKIGDTLNVSPTYTYKDNLKFYNEAFEDPGIQLGETGSSEVSLQIVNHPDSVFEGESSGFVRIPSDKVLWQAKWLDNMPLPAGEQMWLEMDYKCNNSFAAGLYATSGVDEIKSLTLILNPTSDDQGTPQWNKIYIELTQTAAQYLSAQHFNLYLECSRDADNDVAELWLDNIKVIHYE